jgi:hypothetical protein
MTLSKHSDESDRIWTCIGCGRRAGLPRAAYTVCCGICQSTFQVNALKACGLTGDEEIPFGEHLNRLSDENLL